MTRLICVLLTLFFSLSGPAMGGYSDFRQSSNAANREVIVVGEGMRRDAAGFIPGLGLIPDVLNAGIHLARGNYLDAGLSLMAAIPLAGDAIKASVIVGAASIKFSKLNAARGTMFSSNLGSGGSRASTELLNNMRGHGRTITIATEGSEELRFLNAVGAEASVGGAGRTSIILRENPSKVAAMEEFLHGTQERLGIIDRRGIQGAEDHVTDFMERHRRLLGLDH